MAPEIQAAVRTTQAWLQSSWSVQVPFAWLEACVQWLLEEAGGAGYLSQQQINQQALDQWLLTDLRDLDYPVLPEGLAQAQKTKLSGTFCVQVDSLLDISQPAYGQLQKWRGTDCANDEVSAVTQATQRPWEAKSTRMLLMQVTDGVQSLEAMEYQPIPALSTALRPGAKLQLQGQIVCRLGVLLLGPSNIKVLGGEVEDLVDRNDQGRVLCRMLGLPEEEQQQQEEEEEAPPAPPLENQDLELDDAELLASVESQGVEGVQGGSVTDSGYRTLSEFSNQSSRSSSIRSHVFTTSSRSGSTQSGRGSSVQSHYHRNDTGLSDHMMQDHNMTDEDFPNEDFDDLPLDELDSVIFQESTNAVTQSDSSHRNTPQNNSRITGNPNSLDGATKTAQLEQQPLSGSETWVGSINSRSTTQKRDYQGYTRGATGQSATVTSTQCCFPAATEPSHDLESVTSVENDFMDEDMDCIFVEAETFGEQTGIAEGLNQLPPSAQQGPSRNRESSSNKVVISGSTYRQSYTSDTSEFDHQSAKKNLQSGCTVPAVTLTSPPFTYLCLLEGLMSKPQSHTTEIHVKAFIVTLLGKLSSTNGVWRVCATISDGTGYLDVELSDEVLTGLLGFSVAEKGALKRDPARKGVLDAGMRRCQEELVDMCCVMTIVIEPQGRKAVVTKADPVTEKVLQELEQRVRERKK
ncbi:recQ-mediated genome instability protein 1 isoform X2 [Mastacembelus armatus]|uniref:recQ-mediated genome instability protein 1 isoform X2 n=1 Tax=Mastacembelus armatus TaxID=205130 RepID=UPI000E464140|nr:recQ-mediated genome instability protein 1 isoform X2 [Mastacembelus armatus]